MPLIILKTEINAPIERCFDLSRSIDLHQVSTARTGERAIAGKTSGLLNLGETVTWRAKHFGIWQELSSEMTECEHPFYFVDEMIKGTFKSIRHKHSFSSENEKTIMLDEFNYESPLGILGSLANVLVLARYLRKFLEERNTTIKNCAESEEWKAFVK